MTTGSNRVFHSDKYPHKTLIPVTIGDDSQVEEPHVWFQKNQSKPRYIPFHWDGSKPEDQRNNLKLARELVVSGILSGNPKKDLILAYCQYIMKAEMVDISSTEWKSFNQQIVDAGVSISALELLSPTGTSNLVSLEGSADGFVGTGVDLYLMIALASMWRYGRVNPNASAEYRTRLQDNFRKVLDSTLPTDLSAADKESLVRLRDFNDYVNTGGNWVSDAQMDILMAACDMFLNKFRSHPYSLVRLGSITARYKDCSALLSINSCLKMHGFGRIDDLIPWCFSTVFTDELFQLCNPNEELSSTDSYFPYHMDMKLCRKTPFSSSANPHLFALIHVVGSMKNVQRSLNAVMPQNIAIDIVMINALLMGYAFRNSPNLTFSHFDKNEEKTAKLLEDIKRQKQAEEQERGANVSEMLSVPSSNHPADWYRYYLAHGKKLSKEIVDYAKSLTFGNALREGSIGKHTKLYFEQSLDSTVDDQ